MKPVKEGKVRQIYDNGDSLIMVATDRISCFDVILNNVIEKKGTVLTQMSKFWFDYTKDIVDNHMISTDVKDMPEFFQTPEFEGKSMLCKKLKMLPLECIVRGYITGSGWASYKKDGTVCGIKLPEGLKESEKLPEPIYTPSTKAEIGDHDLNISYEEARNMVLEVINNRKAYHKLLEFIEYQGGDYNKLPKSNYEYEIKSDKEGYLIDLNSLELAKLSSNLGSGRKNKEDKIDYSAGIIINKNINDKVNIDDTILTLYTNKEIPSIDNDKLFIIGNEINNDIKLIYEVIE